MAGAVVDAFAFDVLAQFAPRDGACGANAKRYGTAFPFLTAGNVNVVSPVC
jgi:hypothetical protein